MYKSFAVAATVLALTVGAASAQTTSSQTSTSTTVTPAVPPVSLLVPPPIGTLSTTHTSKTINADGSQIDSKSSTYRNTNGVAEDSATTTTTKPAMPNEVITNHTTSSTTTTK